METFFIYLLKSSGVILLFLVCYKLFLSRETFHASNRYFLLSGLALAMVLPLITYTKTIWIELSTLDIPILETIEPVTVEVAHTIEWLSILFIIYSIGIIYGTIRLLVQLLSLRKVFRNSRIVQDGKFRILESNKPLQPFSFFKYIIYHPESHSEEDIKAILAHEKVHSRQFHSRDILVMHLFAIFQWCNPFIYLYNFYLKENLEFIADANTISTSIQKEKYQLLLVKSSMGERHFPFVNPFFNSSSRLTKVASKLFFGESFGQVKKRIVMLNKKKSNKRNRIKYGLMLPLLVGFILLFNVETVAKVRKTSPSEISTEQDQQSVDPKVYSISKKATDEEIEALKKEIKKWEGNLIIENLKRNSKGQITFISVSLKVSEAGSVTQKFSGKNGIESIFFGQNDGGGHSFMRNKKDIVKLKNDAKRKTPKIDFKSANVYSIHKKTSDKEIKQIKSDIEKKGKEFSYTLKRNSKGEIIDLELEIKIKTGRSGRFKSEPSFESCYFGFFKETGVFIADDEKAFNELKKRNAKDTKGLGSNLKEIQNDKFNEVVYDKEKTGDFPHGIGFNYKSYYSPTYEGDYSLPKSSRTSAKIDNSESNKFNEVTYDKDKSGDFPPLTVFNYRPGGFVLQQRWPIGETTLKSVIAASKENIENKKFNKVTYDKDKSGDFPHGIGLNYPYSGPLYLVNGVETPYKTIGKINPSTIESINVLRGEQSLSIYGEKGKHGVIQINTRDTFFQSPSNLNIDAFISEYGAHQNPIQKLPPKTNDSWEVTSGPSPKNKDKMSASELLDYYQEQTPNALEQDIEVALIMVDGKEMSKKKFDKIPTDEIESMSVLKGESAEKNYGKKGKNGVIEVTLKKKDLVVGGAGRNPLILIDGKEASNEEMENLNQDEIESVSILKDDQAVKKYGKKGKEGVVEVITKKE